MISLIHPSRGRPEKSFKNSQEWIEKAGCEVELIIALDDSDPKKESYYTLYSKYFAISKYSSIGLLQSFYPNSKHITMIIQQGNNVVQATNIASKRATGNILCYFSDDFSAPDKWGQLILKEFEGITEPCLIKVDDLLQKFDVPVLTIPIMNRALYERLGYFFHPDFKSMFCDEHLYWVAKKLGALKLCPNLKFPHEHVSIGKAENDETYRRSAANWEQGKAMFAKHKALGFPV